MRTLAVVTLLMGVVTAALVPADAQASWWKKAIAQQKKASKDLTSPKKKGLPPKQDKRFLAKP